MHDESKNKPDANAEGADPARRHFMKNSALAGLAGAAGLALAGCGRKGDLGGAEGAAGHDGERQREHGKHDEFIGPRLFVYTAALEMHPLDTEDRLEDLKKRDGLGYCNITKCCTTVCPEHITITDNAIIPLKERVVDAYYDPLARLFRGLGKKK